MNPHGHQDGDGCVEQISSQNCPESIIRDTKWSCGARMERPPDVGPLALKENTIR